MTRKIWMVAAYALVAVSLTIAASHPASAGDPKKGCFRLEGIKLPCQGDICPYKTPDEGCKAQAPTHTTCETFSVCGKSCTGTAEPIPPSCGQCYKVTYTSEMLPHRSPSIPICKRYGQSCQVVSRNPSAECGSASCTAGCGSTQCVTCAMGQDTTKCEEYEPGGGGECNMILQQCYRINDTKPATPKPGCGGGCECPAGYEQTPNGQACGGSC